MFIVGLAWEKGKTLTLRTMQRTQVSLRKKTERKKRKRKKSKTYSWARNRICTEKRERKRRLQP